MNNSMARNTREKTARLDWSRLEMRRAEHSAAPPPNPPPPVVVVVVAIR